MCRGVARPTSLGGTGRLPFRSQVREVKPKQLVGTWLSGVASHQPNWGEVVTTPARGADAHVGAIQLILRFALAIAVALLSVPLLGSSAAFAEGDETATSETANEAESPPEEPPAEDPPAEEPAPDEEAAPEEESAPEEPAEEEPAAEEPAAEEEVAEEEPAAEEEQLTTSSTEGASVPSSTTEQAITTLVAPTGDPGVCDTNVGEGSVDLFQQNTQEDAGGDWINGALNQNNSNYAEGDFVPQRVVLDDLTPGEHELVFTYDVTKSGLFAYDFVDHLAIIDEPGASISWDAPAPVPPVTPPPESGDVAEQTVHVTFQIPLGTDGSATIRFDGHIASELDYGPDMGAGTISGAPYHISLQTLNCASAGQQDNQLMAAAVDAGEITVIKDAQPNSPTDFDFTIVPGGAASDFSLDDDADGTLPNQVTFRVAPGTYDVSEVNIPDGWTLTGLTCDFAGGNSGSTNLGAATATTTVVDDGHSTCTFTNSREATVEVDKLWVINGGNPVAEGSEPGHLGLNAQLKIDGANEPWNTVIGGFLQGDSLTLDEVVDITNPLCEQTGSSIDTGDGNLPEDVTLGGGANNFTITNSVTCDAELTLVKQVVNDSGGSAEADEWTLHAGANSGTTGTTFTVTADDELALSESGGPSGYDLTSITCDDAPGVEVTSVVPGAGEVITCTFVNDDRGASLTLIKHIADPDGSGTTITAEDFTLFATPQDIEGQSTVSGPGGFADADVKAGSYALSETYFGETDDFEPGDWSCVGGSFDGDTDVVTLPNGGSATCQITNTAVAPLLTLVKNVDDNGTGLDTSPQSWTLHADGPDSESGAGGFGPTAVAVGDYDLTEVGPGAPGWTASDWECSGVGVQTDQDGTGHINLDLGDVAICQITNTAVAPELTLEKVVDNGETGGTAVDTDWTLRAENTGDSGIFIEGPEGPDVTDQELPVGTYALSEFGGPDGYSASSWVCNGEPVDGQVELTLGADITCVITNTAQGSTLTLIKVVDPLDTGDTTPADAWTLTAEGPVTLEGTTGVSDTVPIGSYALSETGPSTYEMVGWDCEGATVVNDQVVIGLDMDVVCTVTNQAIPGDWQVTKAADPASGSTVLPGDQVTYTLTVEHLGDGVPVLDVQVTDDLSDVLDNATLVDGPNASEGTAAIVGTTLTWDIPTVDGTHTVSYTVQVNPDQWGEVLNNLVTGDNCPEDCSTTHPIPHYNLWKTNVPGDGETVEPGESVTYTLHVENDSDAVLEGEEVTDDLSDVLDNATLQLPLDPALSLAGTDLTWAVPTLGPGDVATVSYTVVVDADQWDEILVNLVTPGDAGDCPESEPDCSTTNPTPHWVLTKSSEPPSGSEVMPGDSITYTLHVENDSDGVVEDAAVTDDLSDVLDNATLDEGSLGAGVTVSGTTLTWELPTLAPGATAETSYTVTVNASQWDADLVNVATPVPGSGGECVEPADCSTDHTTPPVTTLVVQKVNFETSEPLAGATFELYVDNAPIADPADPVIGPEDELVSSQVSGADGLAKWAEILPGSYLVEETEAPEDYLLPDQPVMAITVDEENFIAGGEMAPIIFRDFAEGLLAVVAKRQFELIGGEWIESDGTVDYGDVVKYVVAVEAIGPKLFHNVKVTDYVPGWNPEDTTSTAQATLVPDSAVCTGSLEPICDVTVSEDNLVTWTLGSGDPITDIAGEIEMVVQFPELPADPVFDENGEFVTTLWNVGFLEYDEVIGGTPDVLLRGAASRGTAAQATAAAFEFLHTVLRSNEVVVSAVAVQPTEPFFPPPEPPEPPEPPTPPTPPLPKTGASAYLTQLALLGGLALLIGMALALSGRRRETRAEA